jgi:hypothetical protein
MQRSICPSSNYFQKYSVYNKYFLILYQLTQILSDLVKMSLYNEFIDNLEKDYLFSDKVDWKKLRKQVKQILTIKSNNNDKIEIFLQILLHYLDPHCSYRKITKQINNIVEEINPPSIVSLHVKGNKLKILYYDVMKIYEYDNLNKYYLELYNIFKNNTISEIELDISYFRGGNAVLSILFIKFLFQKQKMNDVCYIVYRDDVSYTDLIDCHPDMNIKVRKIPNMDRVKLLKIRIGAYTMSSGQMLCVSLLSIVNLYENFKYIGCNTIDVFNSVLALYKIGNYELSFSLYHFMSINFWISKGSIELKEINNEVKKLQI